MNRLLATLALLALPALASAQTPSKATQPTLTYKLSIGGMAAGIFKSLDIPSHKAIIQLNDVAISELKSAITKKTIITIGGGRLSSFLHQKLVQMQGQQMTVEIEVSPIGLGVGKRCTFTLDDAYLKSAEPDQLKFRPSEMPKYTCR